MQTALVLEADELKQGGRGTLTGPPCKVYSLCRLISLIEDEKRPPGGEDAAGLE